MAVAIGLRVGSTYSKDVGLGGPDMDDKQHFAVLDGLRGVAALVVLFFHTVQHHDLQKLPQAGLAVDFFYILSGFVIAYAYEKRLESSMNFSQFMRIRIIRLYPLLFVGVMSGLLLLILSHFIQGRPDLRDVFLVGLLAILLLPSYVFPQWATAYPLNMAGWSLTFEFYVNIVYALIVRYLSTRRLVIVVVLSLIALIWLALKNNMISGGNDQDNWIYGFIRVMFPFFCGVLLYRLRPASHLSNISALAANLFLAILLLSDFGRSWLIDLVYVVCILPAVVYFGSSLLVDGKTLSRFLLMGRLSYPVYILQDPIIRFFAEVNSRIHASFEMALAIDFLQILTVIVASYLALKYFDEPVRAWLTARSRRRLKPVATT
ncbi:acyltransferase [Mesorhizobium sp.]|uniref:acyltransferase family protein n=1 Tax=Mesorhizobium sp. TaxID=1871066 RepID=UPI000FE48484|nr:acyltransferase [Mesorhizobium sp.]RWA62669.1 MAG: acyltransferase [Mesorhizobium sp.]RWF42814.1 MAG: acyltransferase [Mesorhizobium sp.]TIX11832.1 MAG: acyltransferase [Mesorhizobium sp.]TIX41793.1 MAG: acyltransferase [Mesorhizobium sp.]TJW04961.1 MAG: acyltransferase [Mesorhizobium sp.]